MGLWRLFNGLWGFLENLIIMGVNMFKSVKHSNFLNIRFLSTCFLVACLFISNSLFGGKLPIDTMKPTGAVDISQTGMVSYEINPNVKNVSTNSSEVKASIIDLTTSMPVAQLKLFQACGFIPMQVTVDNKSDKIVRVSPDVLDLYLGLSVDKIKDVIVKSFKLKKYEIYVGLAAYSTIIFAAAVTAGVYFPYSEVYSFSKDLLDESVFSNVILNPAFELFSEIPSGVKFVAGVGSLGLALKCLTPPMITKMSHVLVDKYYKIKSIFKAPNSDIKELDKAIDYVVNLGKDEKLYDVNSNSSKQFVIFVKRDDAVNIKNDITFPVLKFE